MNDWTFGQEDWFYKTGRVKKVKDKKTKDKIGDEIMKDGQE